MSFIDKNKVTRHFSLSAHRYDHVTPVQHAMAERLLKSITARYFATSQPINILEIGCGTGRLTEQLRFLYPQAHITAIDISDTMVNATSQRCQKVEVIRADGEDYLATAPIKYDLVISNATFQWFNDPYQAVINAYNCLTDNGVLGVASFGQNTFHELRQSFHNAYKQLLIEPREHVVDMIDVQRLRKLHNDVVVDEYDFILTFADVRSFLKSIQAAGAVYPQSTSTMLRRDVYTKMTKFYQQQFLDSEQAICATYHTFKLILPAPNAQ